MVQLGWQAHPRTHRHGPPEEREGICKISDCYSSLREFINISRSKDSANEGRAQEGPAGVRRKGSHAPLGQLETASQQAWALSWACKDLEFKNG